MIIVDIRPEIVNAIIILIQGYFACVVITTDRGTFDLHRKLSFT
jgi:hypothetical protein